MVVEPLTKSELEVALVSVAFVAESVDAKSDVEVALVAVKMEALSVVEVELVNERLVPLMAVVEA